MRRIQSRRRNAHTYSKAGKLLKTVDALGGETSYEYNAKPEQPVKDPPGNSSRVELREEQNGYSRSGFGLVKAGILVEKQLRS